MKSRKNKVILFYGKQSDAQINDWIPYNVLYLTAPLVEAGFEPIFINEFTDPDYEGIIKGHAEDSVVFGVSAFTTRQIVSGLEASRTFRKYAPDTPIVWGGHHAKALPEQTIKHELIDMVFTGPSENSFVQVVSAIKSDGNVEQVPGLLAKVNGEVKFTGKPLLFDISKLPPFPFHIVQIEKYINPNTQVLNYTASCGCPGCCSFCPWNGPHPWRSLPIKRVLDDIEWLVHTYGVRTIWLSDANFFANKEFVMKFSEGLLERRLDIYWYTSTRVIELAKFTREEIAKLEQSGLVEIFLGIEQTTDRMKKLLRKPFKLEHVDTILERAKGLNVMLRLAFLFGLPTETLEDLEDSYNNFKRWQSINENVIAQASQYRPYPGDPMYELAIAKGLIPPDTLEGWGTFPLLNTRYRTSEEQRNIWNDVPWFSGSFNKEYGNRFLKLFPFQEGITFNKMSEGVK